MKIETKYVEQLLAESKKDMDILDFIMMLEAESVEYDNELDEEAVGILEEYGSQVMKYTIGQLETPVKFMLARTKEQDKVDTRYVEAVLEESEKEMFISDFIMNLKAEQAEYGHELDEQVVEVMEEYGNRIMKYTIERLETRFSFMLVGAKEQENMESKNE